VGGLPVVLVLAAPEPQVALAVLVESQAWGRWGQAQQS